MQDVSGKKVSKRAMLSPPRLPAWHGLNEEKRCMALHADLCTLCMHGSLQSGWSEKGLQKYRGQEQKSRWLSCGFAGLMNLPECRTITAQHLAFSCWFR